MATLMPSDLNRLEPLFQEEIECWRRELHWDFSPSAQLIRRFVSSQSLPGFVLEGSGRELLGYTYFIANNPVGFIGDLFMPEAHSSFKGYQMLLDKAVQSLTSRPQVKRIECQIISFNLPLKDLFLEKGFQALPRCFLTYDLRRQQEEPAGQPNGFRVEKWQRRYFEAAARTVQDSYRSSPDFELCYDYQSLQGCSRFLRNLIDNPGCGTFQPSTTLLAMDAEGEVCGVLVTSLISPRTGMIPQISISRRWQGRGVGTHLLRRYFAVARRQGLRRITLSVSAANEGAHRLYRRMGFELKKSFHAFLWKREAS
ncbi:MAG TPA: GNAT family N-acetyltransferase [Acidobacteriota bacterium]|nr:GNAT family N-acetyltransferase [Acidobacteriota bacterium]